MSGQCRARCGEPRLDPILTDPDGDGLHVGCVEAPRDVLPELEGILARHQCGTDRSKQKRIGPSEIGVDCDRQLAYRLFGPARHKDEGLKWAPLVGTWTHAGIAEALAQENTRLGRRRYLIEQRVTVSQELGITGVTDCFDTDRLEVVDWKMVGKTSMTGYRRHGPGPTYRTQAHLYGRGWDNDGMRPRSVRVVFLPRWSHLLSDGWEWAEPYDPDRAEAALARLAYVTALGGAVGLSGTAGPYTAVPASVGEQTCRYCPWLRPGGEADATGCPGNTATVRAKAEASFAKGLIA